MLIILSPTETINFQTSTYLINSHNELLVADKNWLNKESEITITDDTLSRKWNPFFVQLTFPMQILLHHITLNFLLLLNFRKQNVLVQTIHCNCARIIAL